MKQDDYEELIRQTYAIEEQIVKIRNQIKEIYFEDTKYEI